jgi:hypothetical protein
MSSLRLVLGWESLMEAEQAALPALCGLCQALDIRTYWNELDRTLYIASPVQNRSLLILTGASDVPMQQTLAEAIASDLHVRLSRSGAVAAVGKSPAGLPERDLDLCITVRTNPHWSVSAAYTWLHWAQNRKLAGLLTQEVSESAGVADLGARVLIANHRNQSAPQIELLIGMPAEAEPEPQFQTAVADGLYRGLARFWADPVLEQARQILPGRAPDPALPPDAPPEPQVESMEPQAEPPEPQGDFTELKAEPLAAPVELVPPAPVDLLPEPELVEYVPLEPVVVYGAPLVFKTLARAMLTPVPPAPVPPAPVPEPACEPMATPSPAPARAPTTTAPPVRRPTYDPRRVPGNSPVHVFRWHWPQHQEVPMPQPPAPVPAPSALEAFFEQTAPEPEPKAVLKQYASPVLVPAPRPSFQVIQQGGSVIRLP